MKCSVIQEEGATHSELQVQGSRCINYEGGGASSFNILFDMELFIQMFFSLFIFLLEQKPQVGIKLPPVEFE